MAANALTFLRLLRNTRQSKTFNLTVLPIFSKRTYSQQVIEGVKKKRRFRWILRARTWLIIISGIFLLSLDSRENVSVNGLQTNLDFRKRFNFIADIVKHTSNAVVFIITSRNYIICSLCCCGSGFIVSTDGLILTNAHVVDNKKGQIVQVRLNNGKIFEGKVVDIDLHSDLAVVKIKTTNLPVLPLGRSNDLQPGEWVAAIGNPLNLLNSISAGVVSSVYRSGSELGVQYKDMKYIQTDAAITKGNSGGPLVNLDGEVVGVNAMTVAPGISFAIPVEYVKQLLMRIKMNEEYVKSVRTNYNGIKIVHLSQQMLAELRSKQVNVPNFVQDGLFIWNVQENSPAQKAGLLNGDIIYRIGNKTGHDMLNDLYTKDSMMLTIVRNGTMYSVKMVPEKIF